MRVGDRGTLERLRALCLSYPEACERTSWGHPNFCAGRKVFVALKRMIAARDATRAGGGKPATTVLG